MDRDCFHNLVITSLHVALIIKLVFSEQHWAPHSLSFYRKGKLRIYLLLSEAVPNKPPVQPVTLLSLPGTVHWAVEWPPALRQPPCSPACLWLKDQETKFSSLPAACRRTQASSGLFCFYIHEVVTRSAPPAMLQLRMALVLLPDFKKEKLQVGWLIFPSVTTQRYDISDHKIK